MIKAQINIVTDSGGGFTSTVANSPQVALGPHAPFLLYSVQWIDGTLDDGVDAVLSITPPNGASRTLATLTNANDDEWYRPWGIVHDNTGTATTFYTPQVVEGTLKLVVTSGGNVKSGTCICYLVEM